MSEHADRSREAHWRKYAVAGGAVGAVRRSAAVYVTLGRPDNATVAVQPATASPRAGQPARMPPRPARQRMAAFVFKKRRRRRCPTSTFLDASGKPRSTIADFKGKIVLLNLWATWCAPCREEMPALDRLQAALGSDKFEVVALAVDKAGIEGAQKFLDEIKVEKLELYADPTAQGRHAAEGRSACRRRILIDAEGREIGRLAGPAEWDSEEAKALIEASCRMSYEDESARQRSSAGKPEGAEQNSTLVAAHALFGGDRLRLQRIELGQLAVDGSNVLWVQRR